MKLINLIGTIKGGEFDRLPALLNAFKSIKNCKVSIAVEKWYKKRTTAQNSYYWAVIIEYFLQGFKEANGFVMCTEITNYETGQFFRLPLSKKEQEQKAHELLKQEFNHGRSTTENDTYEQEVYYDYCREFIKEWFGLEVPLPDSAKSEKHYEHLQ